MSVFVDTSALYALFDRDDRGHAQCAAAWAGLAGGRRALVTTNYVLLETTALLQRRFGMAAVRDLDDAILPLVVVRWITEGLHRRAADRLRRADRRELSLVDCSSFLVMEDEAIRDAFAVDRDFATAGFRLLPGA